MEKYPFKEFKTINEQIDLLKARDLNFKNESLAKEELLKKNYFDVINGFETLRLQKSTTTEKIFTPDTYFEDFIELYEFDKLLNSEILKVIATLENRLITSISYRFCEDVFGSNSRATPDSYLNLLMYENPFSVYHRIRRFPKGTITFDFIKNINKEIISINREIQIINHRVTTVSSSINYINQNNKVSNIGNNILEASNLLSILKNTITSVGAMINSTPSFQPSGERIRSLDVLKVSSISIHWNKVTSQTHSSNIVNEELDKLLLNTKEINLKIITIISKLSQNSNNLIDSLKEEEVKQFIKHKLFNYDIFFKGVKGNNYIQVAKSMYPYLNTYAIPPFWVIIKTFELGATLRLMYGLKPSILDKVVIDMGLNNSEKIIFLNSIKIIHELRNHCAHFNLVNRFRTSTETRIDKNLKIKLNLTTKSDANTHYEIRLFDTLKVLSQFENLEEISNIFLELFTSSKTAAQGALILNLLERMGNPNLEEWTEF